MTTTYTDAQIDQIAKLIADKCGNGMREKYEDVARQIVELLTHHATIQQNAEDVKEWEEFGRQIEKRLRHNDLGLVGGYPEMIDVLLGKAKRLRALEKSLQEFHGPEMREGEPHDQG